MICQKCNQNQATVHYKQSLNGQNTEIYLCPICYHKLHSEDGFGWNSLFSGLQVERTKSLHCEKCGTTYEHFINGGKFGCANCYEAFDEKLEHVLKRLHGNSQHLGRVPQNNQNQEQNIDHDKLLNIENNDISKPEPDKKQLAAEKRLEKARIKLLDLKQSMSAAVKEEDYEQAAKIRDEIKKMEKKLEGGVGK